MAPDIRCPHVSAYPLGHGSHMRRTVLLLALLGLASPGRVQGARAIAWDSVGALLRVSTVTAVHLQLSGDSPRVLSTHFWGDGPAAAVLAVLRQALDAAQAATP